MSKSSSSKIVSYTLMTSISLKKKKTKKPKYIDKKSLCLGQIYMVRVKAWMSSCLYSKSIAFLAENDAWRGGEKNNPPLISQLEKCYECRIRQLWGGISSNGCVWECMSDMCNCGVKYCMSATCFLFVFFYILLLQLLLLKDSIVHSDLPFLVTPWTERNEL